MQAVVGKMVAFLLFPRLFLSSGGLFSKNDVSESLIIIFIDMFYKMDYC